ncbi:MAG: AtpZ/AtpI family protein [Deltaproteobacteria bacterium]|jgi:F0F1-type ATP synthase assembly protein I|nr:AtpZ/AtpI family protein [Deltaproteobacteria bacterium]
MRAAGRVAHQKSFRSVFMLSAWGFAIVISSFLFLYAGHLLDELLGTSPNFMFGLFFLAVFTCIGRLYQEAWLKRKDV